MPHVSEVGNKEGTVGLGGGQTTPDFGGFAHGWQHVVQRSLLPSHQAPELPQCISLATAQEAPVFVDCQDCLGSESASGQTALRDAPVAALRMAPPRSSLNIEGEPALALVPKALRRGAWKGLELLCLSSGALQSSVPCQKSLALARWISP